MAADSRVIFSTELDESGLKRGLSRLGSSVGAMAKGMGLALGAVATGLGALAKNGMAYNSQMEQYTTSFTTMLGSASAAQAKVAELKEYAAKTPFEMTDLANATKTILGFGVAEERADIAMKRMGDISQGNAEKFNSLSLVYGQVASNGKLMGQDLLQMINAGFNPLQQIAEKTGASMGDLKAVMSGDKTSKEFQTMVKNAQKEVKKLGENASPAAKMLAQIGTEGVISADLVDQAMQIATEKGGLYYGAMDKQSKTAAGLISTLKDNLNALGGDAFAGLSNAAKEKAIPAALAYVDQMTEALRTGGVKGLVSEAGNVLGSVVGDASAFAPQAIDMALGLIQSLVGGLKKNVGKIAKGLAETLKAAAIGMLKAVPDMIATLMIIATEMFQSLAEMAPELIPVVIESLVDAIVELISDAPGLLYAGVGIITSIAKGIVKSAPLLLAGVGKVFASLLFGIKDNTRDINAYVAEKTAGMKEKYDGIVTSLQTLKQTLNDSISTGAATEESAIALLEQLKAYSEIKYPTSEDTANAQAITATLVDMYPKLSGYVGKNGLFSSELSTIQELIRAYAQEAEALAYRDYLTGLFKQKIEATNQLKQQNATYAEEEKSLTGLKNQAIALENLKTAMENFNDTPQDWSSPESIAKVQAIAKAYQDAGGDISGLNINLKDLGGNSYDEFLALYNDLTEQSIPNIDLGIDKQQALLDGLINGESGIVALQTLISTTQTEIDSVATTISGLTTSQPTEPEKTTRSMKTNVDGDIRDTGKALDNAKTSLHDKAVAVRDSITSGLTGGESGSGSETESGTSGGIAGAGSAIIDQFANGMEDNDSINGVIKNKVLSSLSSARTGTRQPAYSLGQYLVSGIAAGASSKSSFLNATLTKIIKDAVAAAKKAAGVNSPSRLFRDQVGIPIAEGIEVGITSRMTGVLAAISKSVAESAQAGKAALDNTLLGRVQSIAGIGYAYPSAGAMSAGIMRGSALMAYGSAGTPGSAETTVYAPQTINFNREMQAPDEIARSIRRQTTYGLAGARR
jgi:tape measure domain-containing protein